MPWQRQNHHNLCKPIKSFNLVARTIFQLEPRSYRANPRARWRKSKLREFPHRPAALLNPGALQARICSLSSEGESFVRTLGSDIIEVTPPSTGTAKERFWRCTYQTKSPRMFKILQNPQSFPIWAPAMQLFWPWHVGCTCNPPSSRCGPKKEILWGKCLT